MTIAYRIYAHRGQVTAIALNKEFANFAGIEVESGEVEDQAALAAILADKAPAGVSSPWPPEGTEVVIALKPKAKKA
jgi:glutamate synthase domain-containing protein 1